MSTLPVVEKILREVGEPMSVREIVEYAKGTLPTKSKTPDTVVARDLSMDIKKRGDDSLFIRTAPGRYTMRALVQQPMDRGNGEARTDTSDMLHSAMKEERAGTLPASGESRTEYQQVESSQSP